MDTTENNEDQLTCLIPKVISSKFNFLHIFRDYNIASLNIEEQSVSVENGDEYAITTPEKIKSVNIRSQNGCSFGLESATDTLFNIDTVTLSLKRMPSEYVVIFKVEQLEEGFWSSIGLSFNMTGSQKNQTIKFYKLFSLQGFRLVGNERFCTFA